MLDTLFELISMYFTVLYFIELYPKHKIWSFMFFISYTILMIAKELY